MAQKTQIIFTDDLDGSEAKGTVLFGLDGVTYEIDLNEKHAKELRDALTQYVSVGRKVSSAPRRAGRGAGRAGRPNEGNPSPGEIREWARSQGIEVSDRGRVPNVLLVKFQAAS